MNLPIKFEDRMRRLLGEEYEQYLRCYAEPHYGGIRVNTLKISPEEFEHICPFSVKRIPWIANGYYYDINEQPARHPYYYAGLYYIQEPSAMTPASLLPIVPGDKVLDICAAPGGKSTELGARLCGKGLLVTNDISNSRAKALLKNIELFGIKNALVLSEAPNKLFGYFPEYFDKILIDAPCSGEGMFRKSPAIMKNWEQYGTEYYNKLQKEIILFAAKMLKPGGTMLYSTCTFSPEENEGTISYLLEQCPEFHVINAFPDEAYIKEKGISYDGFDTGKPEWVNGKEELRNCIRLWPHRIKGEGHFIALLHKGEPVGMDEPVPGGEPYGCSYKKSGISARRFDGGSSAGSKKNPVSDEAHEFLNNIHFMDDGHTPDLTDNIDKGADHALNRTDNLYVRDDRIYMIPEGLPDINGLRVLRQGLLLGEMKKQRFEPSQALANSLHSEEYEQIINFRRDDPQAVRYLKCETIEPEENAKDGWQLICIDSFPLGWGKLTKGSFKNKYLPGWRWI